MNKQEEIKKILKDMSGDCNFIYEDIISENPSMASIGYSLGRIDAKIERIVEILEDGETE